MKQVIHEAGLSNAKDSGITLNFDSMKSGNEEEKNLCIPCMGAE